MITQLYHCTNINSLIKIIQTKYFRYSYCLEDHYFHNDHGFSLEARAYAMVCFADLLPNELPHHMRQFRADSYIMMDKKWTKNNNISPVLYYEKKSLPFLSFLSLVQNMYKIGLTNTASSIKIINALELMAPFLKQYEGTYYLNGTNTRSDKNVEFFLEREWLAVPVVEHGERFFLNLQEYLNKATRDKAMQELVDNNYCLRFEWDDILYIGCKRLNKKDVLHVIQRSFGVDKNQANDKIRII